MLSMSLARASSEVAENVDDSHVISVAPPSAVASNRLPAGRPAKCRSTVPVSPGTASTSSAFRPSRIDFGTVAPLPMLPITTPLTGWPMRPEPLPVDLAIATFSSRTDAPGFLNSRDRIGRHDVAVDPQLRACPLGRRERDGARAARRRIGEFQFAVLDRDAARERVVGGSEIDVVIAGDDQRAFVGDAGGESRAVYLQPAHIEHDGAAVGRHDGKQGRAGEASR